MKTLKRTAMFMAKEHSVYKAMVLDGEAKLIHNSKYEKTYLTENGTASFFYGEDGYVKGLYKNENGVEVNYELKA